MKVLVTGGTGLVGSTVHHRSAQVVRVGSQHYDLTQQRSVRQMYEDHRPTHVIHCAGQVGGIGGNMAAPNDFFYKNIMMNTMVIEEARVAGVERLVAFASTCVFPDEVTYPLRPEKMHLGPPHNSNSAYAYAKRMIEVQIDAIRAQHGINYTMVIPCNIYGPNDRYDETGHVIPSLIRKCYEAKQKGTDFEVWGSGKPLREFIYSEDVGVLAREILLNYEGHRPVILSSGTEVSIAEIVGKLVDIIGFRGKVVYNADRPDGQYRKPSDVSPIRTMFPDFKFTPLDIGLRQAVQWYINEEIGE